MNIQGTQPSCSAAWDWFARVRLKVSVGQKPSRVDTKLGAEMPRDEMSIHRP